MKTTILIAFLLILVGCHKESQTTVQSGNFQVEFLFEHDGCKVYRFVDGRTVYYSDCRGTLNSSYSSGKSTYYDDTNNTGR